MHSFVLAQHAVVSQKPDAPAARLAARPLYLTLQYVAHQQPPERWCKPTDQRQEERMPSVTTVAIGEVIATAGAGRAARLLDVERNEPKG